MSFFSRFLYGKHYDLLCMEFEVIKNEFGYEAHSIFDIIEPHCKKDFKDKEANYNEFEIKKYKYRDIASVIISVNIAYFILTTGRYHIYRGTLGPTGSIALKIFNNLMNYLVESGHSTQEEVKEYKNKVYSEIRTVG